MMDLKEFIEGRDVKQSTVSKYIRRHPELFEGHTRLEGKQRIIDAKAYEILHKQYPFPLLESVWSPEAKRKYDELLGKYSDLQEVNRLLQEKYYKLELEKKALDTTYQEDLKFEAKRMSDAAVSKAERELKLKYKEELDILRTVHKERIDEIHADHLEFINKKDKMHQEEIDKYRELYEAERSKTAWDKLKEKFVKK